jgi:D-aspartate ligase
MNGAIIIEGHVQGLSNTRALGEAGIPVIVIDTYTCLARYSKYCQKFFFCPDYLSSEFVPFLIGIAEKHNLSNWSLIPSNDHAVYSISKNREILETYYKIITPNITTISNIYDKELLLKLAEKCNIPIPKTVYLKSENDTALCSQILPCITKGKNGLSFYKKIGKKCLLATTELDVLNQVRYLKRKIPLEQTFTQELIPFDGSNKTVSFTAFCINGEIMTYWIGEKIREHPIRFGTATYARSIECPDLVALSQPLLKELRYTGVCEVEYLLDPRDRKFKLIEINARTWLWVGLAKACGINYALLLYQFLNGIEINYKSQYIIGMNWINYLTDIPFSLWAILKGDLNLISFVKSYQGRKVNAFFTWSDIKPSVMFFALAVYIAIKRK